VPIEALAQQSMWVNYTTSIQGRFSHCDSCGQELQPDEEEEVQPYRFCSSKGFQPFQNCINLYLATQPKVLCGLAARAMPCTDVCHVTAVYCRPHGSLLAVGPLGQLLRLFADMVRWIHSVP
jgi:hypothetical protein